ncbi:MAG: hypothetical protein HY225_00685 [Candidatus Vogelbacteria bacterium]|nr:hypothetical protein [Candidatus Vogelbacteria bacterium]
MSNKVKIFLSSLVVLMPGIAMAALPTELGESASTLNTIISGTLPKLFFGLAVVYFFYGLGQYAMGVDDKTKAAAKSTMIYGIIIIFVMTSLYGIVTALQGATGTSGSGTIKSPTIGS